MQLKRFQDILAIKDEAKIYGFHARNLQVAELDQAAWLSFFDAGHQPVSNTSEALASARTEIEAWSAENDPSIREDHLPQSVRSLVINITQVCNLRCTYCAAGGDGTYGSDKGKVDLAKVQEQLKFFLSKLSDGDEFNINFFGGEPLVHPEALRALADYAKLMVAGRDIKLRYNITTNGTLITPANAELLASLNCHVTISLDGPARINDVVRPSAGGKGSTEKTLKGIQNLMLVRDRLESIGVNCVFGTHNMKVLEAYEFFQQFDFDFINPIYAVENDDALFSDMFSEQMQMVLEKAHAFGGEREVRKFTHVDHFFQVLDKGERTVNHCGAGKTLLFTDTKADVYACNWFMNTPQEKLGEVVAINEAKLAEYKDPLIEKNNCNTCWARFLCGGGCMYVNQVKTGNKNLKDPYFCKRTRGLAALAIKYYGGYRTENDDSNTDNQEEKGVAI